MNGPAYFPMAALESSPTDIAGFQADLTADAKARAERHGDAFLVMMPGLLARVSDAESNMRVCPVRPPAVARAPIVIGRDPRNDVVVEHASVSNVHAHLKHYGKVYVVRDMGSRNGTFLDGRRLSSGCKPELVRSGARLRFGSADTLFLLFGEFWRFVERIARKPSGRR